MSIQPLKKTINNSQNQVWEQDEQILLFIRRHWFALWPAYSTIGFLIILIFVLIAVFYVLGLNQFLVSLDLVISPMKIFWLIFFILLLLLLLFLFLSWMQYYLDITIVTNKRVIDIEQINLFKRKVVAADLVSIQDVRSEVKGIFGTLLDFGIVFIQTAGEAPNFILKDLPHPSSVVRRITSIASDILSPDSTSPKTIHEEKDLKTHEQEFAKLFKSAKNEYLAPEERTEISGIEKLGEKVKPNAKKSLTKKLVKSKVEKNVFEKPKKKISKDETKGEIDF